MKQPAAKQPAILNRVRQRQLLWIFAIVLLATCLYGCKGLTPAQVDTAKTDVASLQTAVTDAQTQLAAATTQLSTLKAQAATMPITDPQRAKVDGLIDSTQAGIDKLNAWLAKAQPVLNTAQEMLANPSLANPALDGVAAQFGPYAILALTLVRLGYTEYQNAKKAGWLQQLATAIHSAGLTDVQKTAVAANTDIALQTQVALAKPTAPPVPNTVTITSSAPSATA